MSKNLKNLILGNPSFSKVFSIIENTILTCIWRGSLIRTNSNFKTILIGLFLSLLALQCSKSGTTDPVATPTPTSACKPDQTKLADGTCKNPDGTITCKIYETKNASNGLCETINCLSGQTLNKSNGQCETITCPSGQLVNKSGTCADISTFYTTCGGKTGLTGPSVMLLKYLYKSNPNPTSVINQTLAEMAFIVARGCEEDNPSWLSSQSIFNALAYFDIRDSVLGDTSTLNFASNTWDSKVVTIGADSVLFQFAYHFTPKNISTIKNGTGFALSISRNLERFFGEQLHRFRLLCTLKQFYCHSF